MIELFSITEFNSMPYTSSTSYRLLRVSPDMIDPLKLTRLWTASFNASAWDSRRNRIVFYNHGIGVSGLD